MRYLLWLFVFALALPASAQRKLPRQRKAAAAAPAPEPVLIFQRTPCFGTCPSYTATIFADGRVAYDGQRFVSLLGRHTLRLPPATVQQLLAEAKSIGFSRLQERYSGNTSDLPATIITVHPVGQPAKAVYAEENIPANLQGYIKYLQSKLDPLSSSGPTE